MDTQTIDAVALIRQIRDEHYRRLRGKTREERIAYYREQAHKMQNKVSVLLADQTRESALQAQSFAVKH